MTDLEDARTRWLQERTTYDEFAKVLVSRVKDALVPLGFWTAVEFRSKDLDSLIKKLMRGKHTYESLPDKVGVRVIVLYRSNIAVVSNAIVNALHCGNVDLKTPASNVVGYLGTHIDWVRLSSSDPDIHRFVVTRFWAELQIRTQAQHLWSEMSHDGFYKNDATLLALSPDVNRRVNLMAGQIEIADREFDRLREEAPILDEAKLFQFLETLYYRLTSRRPDTELSLQVLRILLPLFNKSLFSIEEELSQFFAIKEAFLMERYRQAQENDERSGSPLLFQPEALVLYERLLVDEMSLRKVWNAHFPEPLLVSFANEMGRSFD